MTAVAEPHTDVANIPGMVAGMVRHMHSLRRMKRDHGWIHTLLEEAETAFLLTQRLLAELADLAERC